METVMAKFILVSRDKEDLYVNVDQVRVLRAQSEAAGRRLFSTWSIPDRIVRLAK